MHDPRVLLDPATDAVRKLARRGFQLDLPALENLFSQRTAVIGQTDESRAESNRLAKEVGAAAKRGEDVTAPRERAKEVKARVQELEEQQRKLAAELEEQLLASRTCRATTCRTATPTRTRSWSARGASPRRSTSSRPTT